MEHSVFPTEPALLSVEPTPSQWPKRDLSVCHSAIFLFGHQHPINNEVVLTPWQPSSSIQALIYSLSSCLLIHHLPHLVAAFYAVSDTTRLQRAGREAV